MTLPTKEQVTRALQVARVLDENGNLSLTNLAFVLTLARLLLVPELTIHDLGAFAATVIGYQVKRFAQPAAPDNTAEIQAAVQQLQTTVTALQMGQQPRR